MSRRTYSAVALALVASLLGYALMAAARHWWPSAIAAPVVAALLWRRHRRARFAAYVFFTVLALRGALTGVWLLPLYATLAVAVLQTRAAAREWPRLQPRWRGDRGDRMRAS